MFEQCVLFCFVRLAHLGLQLMLWFAATSLAAP
ncbi:MAG: hypothetical protein ACI8PT_001665 [Gammaproteobacteria bacterium]|jgi:hypothetical protein